MAKQKDSSSHEENVPSEAVLSENNEGNAGSITGVQTGNAGSIAYQTEVESPNKGIMHWLRVGLLTLVIVGIIGVFAFAFLKTNPTAYNPTRESITFQVNGQEYTLNAMQHVEIPVSRGTHTVTMNGETVGTFDFKWTEFSAGIINPTLSPFVEEEILYATNPSAHEHRLSNNEIEIGEYVYEGPYRLIENQVYLPKTWDYAPWERSPNTVKIKGSYVIKKELHTVEAFDAMFE